ncbi:MAG TPA: 5-formyltetrahydrofolate cyclo-ligase [Candidatus Eisenbacteria bacterium]|nr:5-formyltetrahydrofolate cyclo-ligase [Candidatus Eisenbacteria bacterium]
MGGFDDAGKTRLRREFAGRRRALSEAEVASASRAICAWIVSSAEFRETRHLVLYSPRANEVDPGEVAKRASEQGLPTYYPRVEGDDLAFRRAVAADLHPGPFGVEEPPSGAARLPGDAAGVLVLVPGVAFDRRGGRLGSGRGYYDRALPTLRHATRFGLAAEALVVDRLPQDPWDVCMNAVVTERGILPTPTATTVHSGELT